jgi:hypothetical protein
MAGRIEYGIFIYIRLYLPLAELKGCPNFQASSPFPPQLPLSLPVPAWLIVKYLLISPQRMQLPPIPIVLIL